MLHSSLIKTISVSIPSGDIRPTLSGVHMTSPNVYETTDSFRATRITSRSTGTFPNTENFYPKNFEDFEKVSVSELTHVLERAVMIAKQKGDRSHTVFVSKEHVTFSDGTKIETPKSMKRSNQGRDGIMKMDAKYVLEFIKSLPKQKGFELPLLWYKESETSPLAFRYVNGSYDLDHIIMPLKI